MHNFLKMTYFNLKISEWYQQNQRKLPWRETSDPYKIWISEIILQQTQVKQGQNYYFKFIETFPDIQTLAKTSEQKILKIWQGLGYYSRARNLHKAAIYICNNLSGEFPKTKIELEKLSGIGPYTAAAIASIAFNKPHAVVDGNVYRLLSRFFAISTPIDSTQGKKEFELLANELIDRQSPGTFNQAMMEMGALVCTPAKPQCHICPIADKCKSRAAGSQMQFPVKRKKGDKRTRYFNYVIIRNNASLLLSKRNKGDIWQGLFEPLLIESDILLSQNSLYEILNHEWPYMEHMPIIKSESRQTLTHQIIYARFFELFLPHAFELPRSIFKKELQAVNLASWHEYPVPRLIENFLTKNITNI